MRCDTRNWHLSSHTVIRRRIIIIIIIIIILILILIIIPTYLPTYLDSREIRQDLSQSLRIILLSKFDLTHIEGPMYR